MRGAVRVSCPIVPHAIDEWCAGYSFAMGSVRKSFAGGAFFGEVVGEGIGECVVVARPGAGFFVVRVAGEVMGAVVVGVGGRRP